MPIQFDGCASTVQVFEVARDLFDAEQVVSMPEAEVRTILNRVVDHMVCFLSLL